MKYIKNVLLVDIPTYQVYLSDLHRSIVEKRLIAQTFLWEKRTGHKMIRPALTYSRGLLTIAACLERAGYAVKYLIYSDLADKTRILDYAKEADIVGITVLTPTVKIGQSLCKVIKEVNPKAVIILGGPHVTAMPVETLEECRDIDFLMVGEAEERLPKFLTNINKPDEVGGVVYRDPNGDVMVSGAPIAPVNVAELPMPAYHLLSRSLNEYAHNIRIARGCPYKCNFCFERLSWHSPAFSRHKSSAIIDEVKLLAKSVKKGTLFHFSDAIFNLRWDVVSELVQNIKDLDVFFSMDTRVDLVNAEQTKQLSEAGFIYFRMGYESLQDKELIISDKAITHEAQIRSSEIIRQTDPRVAIHAYMITGLPGASSESMGYDIYQIRRMIETELVDVIGNKILVPYPGTPYYENSESLGIEIMTKDWSKYDRRSYPVYRLDQLSPDEIYSGYLAQEAALTEAYLNKLQTHELSKDNIRDGLDYVYKNYAQG